MLVLVLEASTSSAKAMVYDHEKGIVASRSLQYPAAVSDVETHDTDGVYNALMMVGREEACGRDISAVALGGTWHSVLLCDRDLKPVSRTYTWAYIKAADTAARMRDNAEKAYGYYRRTGCVAHAIYPAFKLLHFKEEGDTFSGRRIIGEGSYIYHRMTGEYATSLSMASGSGLLNIHRLDWDEEVLDMLGINSRQLPELCDHTLAAGLNGAASAALGLKAGIPVIPAHPDGALNQVGAGALSQGIMTLSVGTSAALRIAFDRPVLHKEAGTWCYYAPGKWLSGSAVSGATNCLDWFAGKANAGRAGFEELEKAMEEAEGEPPVFLPFLYGERGPGWNDKRLGGFMDINGRHGIGHLYRGVLEGVLYNLYQCYSMLVKAGGEPESIRVSGGILKSGAWTQMLADIWQRNIECSEAEQASMLGAAALGLLNGNAVPRLEDFKVEKGGIISPDRSKADYYGSRYEKYLYWYDRAI